MVSTCIAPRRALAHASCVFDASKQRVLPRVNRQSDAEARHRARRIHATALMRYSWTSGGDARSDLAQTSLGPGKH